MRTGYLIFLYLFSVPAQAAEENLACIWTFELDAYPLFLPLRHSNCLWDNFGLPQISWPILNIILLWLVFYLVKKTIKGMLSTDKKVTKPKESNKQDIESKKNSRFFEKYNISGDKKNEDTHFDKLPTKINENLEGIVNLKYDDGSTYKGGMNSENQWHGYGEISLSGTGGSYKGEFKDGDFHGSGKRILLNDDGSTLSTYEGHFVNGKCHGEGKTIFSNGEVYEGQYKNNELNGEVKVKHSSGDSYIGNYKNDKRDGFGIYKYTNGETYEGNWIEGYLHQGKYRNKVGDEYVGDFVNVKREGGYDEQFHGEGTYLYSNGETYVGTFKNNKRHGKGTLKSKEEGIIFDGLWENDKQVE